MRNLFFWVALFQFSAVVLVSCGGAPAGRINTSMGIDRTDVLLALASKMEGERDFFRASQLYTFALANGADERTVLSRLAVAQARCGRLAESRLSLIRLLEVASEWTKREDMLVVLTNLKLVLSNLLSQFPQEDIPSVGVENGGGGLQKQSGEVSYE